MKSQQNMSQTMGKLWIYFTIFSILILNNIEIIESRYLPTRSQDDRLDKLRELLRDLLESEIQRSSSLECGSVGQPSVQIVPNDIRNGESRTNQRELLRELGIMPGVGKRYFKRSAPSTQQQQIDSLETLEQKK